jgi:hypothetical protein
MSPGEGNYKYFDYTIRKKILAGELYQRENLDSHTTMAHHFGIEPIFEELWNRWEYNPLTQELKPDQKGKTTKNDNDPVLDFCRNLDFFTIVPELIIKPMINPLNLGTTKATESDIKLLHSWDSVWTSVRASVWAYGATFFKIEYKIDLSACQELWERGLVPSFDGKVWRLHGSNGKIIYTE